MLRNVRYRSGKPLEHSNVQTAIANAEKRLNGHGRLVVRPSGTEPVIRIMGEGDDKAMVEEVVDGIVDALTANARSSVIPAKRESDAIACRLPGSALRGSKKNSPARLQKLRERLQRVFRNVVLDAFGVGLRRFSRHA